MPHPASRKFQSYILYLRIHTVSLYLERIIMTTIEVGDTVNIKMGVGSSDPIDKGTIVNESAGFVQRYLADFKQGDNRGLLGIVTRDPQNRMLQCTTAVRYRNSKEFDKVASQLGF